jgi:hypothetical protein
MQQSDSAPVNGYVVASMISESLEQIQSQADARTAEAVAAAAARPAGRGGTEGKCTYITLIGFQTLMILSEQDVLAVLPP